MPKWEICTTCGTKYNPTLYTAEERLLQAIFGEHLCPKCKVEQNTVKCTKCMNRTTSPIYYNDDPYHSECLAKVVGK